MKKRSKHGHTKTSDASAADSISRDTSPYIHQSAKLKHSLHISCKYPLTEKQQVILDTATDKRSKVIMIDGYWGTGKNLIATLASLQLMNEKKLSGIVYIRNPLEATNTAKVGTLPGSLEDRMELYNAVLYDKLGELLPKSDIDLLEKEERIECYPVGLIQGRTFACKAVIVDEAASLSWDDLMLVISRMGEYSKLFIIGDSKFQLAMGNRSGFRHFFETFYDADSQAHGVFNFELRTKEDIKRSGLLRFVMEKTGAIPHTVGGEPEPMFPTPYSV